jgi:hypothetical protein
LYSNGSAESQYVDLVDGVECGRWATVLQHGDRAVESQHGVGCNRCRRS